MEQVTFTYIPTKCKYCRFDFYILNNIMFVVSNFNTEKQCLLCGYDEDWIEIIKDRGYWENFHNKIAASKYQQGNPFSEMERKCFEQMVDTIKQLR